MFNQFKLLLAALFVAMSGASIAQNYPNKPVNLMVPYPAGGLSDVIARVVNHPLSKQLGQPVIIENLGGASGGIGAQKVLSAPADGYYVFQGSPNELILGPLSNAALKFKSEDFRLVQTIGYAQIAFLIRKDIPANSVDEFLDYAKKQAAAGKPVTYASVGTGSYYHVITEQMSKITGIPMTHVPYKGAAPANQDLVGGQVDLFLGPLTKTYEEFHAQGRLKILAILNKERLPSTKAYPAISESKSLKTFTHSIWTGYFVKKDTPEEIVQKLHKALTATLSDSSVKSGLEANSLLVSQPLPLSAVTKNYTDGINQFRAIAKTINLQPQ
jgi:tripartite-type tricarboxylate transporter receptor subunit TctC